MLKNLKISFIIVGRNEGWKLSKCLQSVNDTIAYNQIEKHEVIYVDSQSSDDSVIRAKAFEDVKVILLTKDFNSAIARNVGAKEATGDIFYFVDGDMELQASFLPLVYNERTGLIRDFVSGNWINYYFTVSGNYLRKEPYMKMVSDQEEKVTGGLFLIKAQTWNIVNGMRSVFKRSQDIDLGLRLAKKDIFLFRKKEIAAKHHTISYLDKNRMWKDLIQGNELYGRSLLYRNHITNRQMYSRLFRNDYSMLILLFLLIFILFTGLWQSIVVYGLIVGIRSKFNFMRMMYIACRDVSVIGGFIFFHPQRNFEISYQVL